MGLVLKEMFPEKTKTWQPLKNQLIDTDKVMNQSEFRAVFMANAKILETLTL